MEGSNPQDGKVATEDPAITAQKLLKAKAEAETAEIARDKAARERAESESPLSDSKREAEDRKAIDKANQEGAEARQKQLAALLPDLSKIEGGELKTADGSTLFGPTLAKGALSAAVAELAGTCVTALDKANPQWRLLVTTDAELATSDAVCQDVLAGIKQMRNAMTPLLPPQAPDQTPPEDGGDGFFAAALPLGVVAAGVSALASAVPAAISLLLPRRTLTSSKFSVDSTAATAAAIGALKEKKESATIVHDGFRLLPSDGTVLAQLTELETGRQTLVGHKLALEDTRTQATADASAREETIKAMGSELKEAAANDKPAIEANLLREKTLLATHRKTVSDASTRIGLIESAVTSVDNFLNTLRTAAPGAAASPLATALLREQLHRDKAEERFSHVLLIEADEGSSHQVLDDRRFKADRVSVVGVVNVSYVLIDAATSAVLASGVASGSKTISGRIGDRLELNE